MLKSVQLADNSNTTPTQFSCLWRRKTQLNFSVCTSALIKKQRTAIGNLLITELQLEGARERALARFNCDDDVPRVPCPLDSPQSRRAVGAA